MPDRAKDWPELTAEEERAMSIHTPKALLDQLDEEEYEAAVERYKASLPRAVVAISEDRQWLVVLERCGWWRLRRRDDDEHFVTHETGVPGGWIYDTGQSAEDVLSAFLGAREEQDRAAD